MVNQIFGYVPDLQEYMDEQDVTKENLIETFKELLDGKNLEEESDYADEVIEKFVECVPGVEDYLAEYDIEQDELVEEIDYLLSETFCM